MTQDPFDADAGFESARRQLADIQATAKQNSDRASSLASAVESIVAHVSSARGEVQAHAKPGGRIVGLDFGPSAQALSLSALAHLTLDTIQRAQQSAMVELARHGEQVFGPGSAVATSLHADAERAYGSNGSAD